MFGRLRAGAARYTDGTTDIVPRGGNNGEAMVSQLMPPRFEMALRLNSFIYHVASQAPIILGTNCPTIINPVGSGVLWVAMRLALSWISGAITTGSVIWAKQVSSGTGIPSTGGNPATATFVAPISTRVNNSGSPKCLWAPSVITWTTAPTAVMATGLQFGASGPLSEGPMVVDYNGELVLEPGNSLQVAYTVTTATGLFQITVIGAEVPYFAGQ